MWTVDTFKPLVYAAENAIRKDVEHRKLIIETASFPEFMKAIDNGENEITLALARDNFLILEKIVFDPFSLDLSIVRNSVLDQLLWQECEKQHVMPVLRQAMSVV